MNEELVKCTALRRDFGPVQALCGVDLTLTSGKIVGLLGPNGSGKTTLIKILNGLLRPTAGEARIAGMLPGPETKSITSYLPDRGYFPEWMRVGDMMDMFTDFYADFDRAKATDMCGMLGLQKDLKIKTLSKGTKEKMQLMLVMSRRAKLYLLDEPIAGVDPAAREFILRTILTNYNENGTVLISTHLIADVEQVLDEAVFLQNGQIALHASVDSIREKTGGTVDALFRNMYRMPVWNGGNSYAR
jgi:ABC-2 type transport system ATP-binding protein